jgi:hypothetical protein
MGLRLSTGARNAAGDAITALLNAGGAGTIEVRTGAQPTDPGTAVTGTLLATFTLSATAFAAFASGTGNLNTVASVTAAATGTAGWFRMKNNAGTGVIDGDVGTSGRSAEPVQHLHRQRRDRLDHGRLADHAGRLLTHPFSPERGKA